MIHSELTSEQQRAVDCIDRDCVVVAGPGAGKTRVLIWRVVNLLRCNRAKLEDFAAITFTNKAANEMKERLRHELANIAKERKVATESRHWTNLKSRLEHAEISTIHGFCAGILRAQPVEAKVDPSFNILDDYTSVLLITQAAEEAVNEFVEAYNEVATRLVISYGRRELIGALKELYTQSRGLGLFLNDIEQLTSRTLAKAEDYSRILNQIDKTVNSFLQDSDLKPTQIMTGQLESFKAAWQEFKSEFCTTALVANSSFFDESMRRILKAIADAKGLVKGPITGLKAGLKELELVFYDCCSEDVIKLILRLLHEIERRYNAEKEARHALDYDDLQWKVRDLLKSYPSIARHYAKKYRFILLDEFQDTNGLQREIIDLLTSDGNRDNNLFVVGDAKQSIYNFRGAEVEVFETTAQKMIRRGAAEIRLQKNFRSTPQLIRFANAFFSKLMTHELDKNQAQLLGYVSYSDSIPARVDPPLKASVELILEVGDHLKTTEERREREAENIAFRIRQMIKDHEQLVTERGGDSTEMTREVRYGDIAILFRAITDIKVYEEALRRAGIPYYLLAGKGFYQREEIQDVLSLLQFLENRTDQIGLVAALRSPLFGISDETLYRLRQQSWTFEERTRDHHSMFTSLLHYDALPDVADDQKLLLQSAAETLNRLVELRHRVSPGELLQEIFRITNFAAVQAIRYDGYQRCANLAKLLDLAFSFEATGPYFLGDFICFIRQFTEMESRESEAQLDAEKQNAVRLMTMHKAKGLEFPVVILPDLERRLQPRIPSLTFDRSLGIGIKVPDKAGQLHKTALQTQVVERVRLRELFERQRLLFVAITRARDYLVLAGTRRAVKSNPRPLKAQSYVDWLFSILPLGNGLDLPSELDWEGVKIKISNYAGRIEATSDLTSNAVKVAKRSGSSTLADRYRQIRSGKPCDITLDDWQASEANRVIRFLEPLPFPLYPDSSARKFSATSLATFARCPLEYYYQTTLRLQEADRLLASDHVSAANTLSASVRGKVIHRFCELYDGTVPAEQVLERALKKENQPSLVSSIKEQTWPLIERYLNSPVYSRIQTILRSPDQGSVLSEVEFVYRSSNALLSGRIDKLIIDKDRLATVIDFKTLRTTADQVTAAAKEHELQMQIYSLVAQEIMPVARVQAQIYFMEPDILYPVVALDKTDTATLIDNLLERVLEAKATKKFPPNPEPARCRSCTFFSICPEKAV